MIIQQFDQKALLRPSRVPHELSVTVLFEVNFWPQRKKWRLFVQALLIVKSLQFDLHDICTGCLYDPFCLILFLHNSSAIQVDSLAMVTGELEGRSLKEPWNLKWGFYSCKKIKAGCLVKQRDNPLTFIHLSWDCWPYPASNSIPNPTRWCCQKSIRAELLHSQYLFFPSTSPLHFDTPFHQHIVLKSYII